MGVGGDPKRMIIESGDPKVHTGDETRGGENRRPSAVFIVGPTCCGKTEAGRHLAGRGFTWIEPSQYVKKEVPLDIPILTRLKMVDSFFERVGKDYVAKCLLSHVLDGGHQPPFVITGCRQAIEVQLLTPRFRTVVIALHADDSIRFARCTARSRGDATINFETFLRATAWEYSLGLAEIVHGADWILLNNRSLSDLHHAIERIVAIARQP